jgi:hypothetical protein
MSDSVNNRSNTSPNDRAELVDVESLIAFGDDDDKETLELEISVINRRL